METLEYLFGPTTPFLGVDKGASPAALLPGEWSRLSGWRYDRGVLRVRYGDYALSSTANYSGTFAGVWGTNYGIAGNWLHTIATTTDIYYNTGVGAGTYSTATASSGKYGNTKLTAAPVYGYAQFALVKDPFHNAEALIVQNGSDYPRVVDLDTGTAAIAEPIEVPNKAHSMVPIARPHDWLDVTGSPGGATVNSSARLTFTITATAAPISRYWLLMANAAQEGDTAQVVLTDTMGIGNVPGVMMVIADMTVAMGGSVDASFFQKIKIEIVDNGGRYYTIHDPTNGLDYRAQKDITSNVALHGFPCDDILSATFSPSSITGLRVTWTGPGTSTHGTAVYFAFFVVGTYGGAPGNRQHVITYANNGSKCESQPLVLPSPMGAIVMNLGGVNTAPGFTLPVTPKTVVPVDERFFYDYDVPFLNCSTSERNKGVDRIRLYAYDPAEPAEEHAYFVAEATFATWSGASWSFDAPATNPYQRRKYTDQTPSLDRNYFLHAPPDDHIPLPKGLAMRNVNNRLFVAGIDDPSARRAVSLYVSEDGYPFRFLEAPRVLSDGTFDPVSATRIDFAGEACHAIAADFSAAIDTANVYVLTDVAVYGFTSYDAHGLSAPRRLGTLGTLSPHSVAESSHGIFWLTQDMRIATLRGGVLDVVAPRKADASLDLIPSGMTSQRQYASGVVFKDQYRLIYTTSSTGASKKMYIYDILQGHVLAIDEDLPQHTEWYPFLIEQYNGQYRLIGHGKDGKTYQIERSGQTADVGASGIPVAMTSRGLHAGLWRRLSVRGIGVLMQAVSGGQIAWTRTEWPSGASRSSVTSLTETRPYVYRWDSDTTSSNRLPVSSDGVLVQIAMSGSLPGGTEVYAMVAEIVPVGKGSPSDATDGLDDGGPDS